jgi:flagellar biosynthesis protein FliP
MLSYLWECLRVLTTCILVTIFTLPPDALSQIHVVSPTDLQKEAVAATQARKRNLETVRQFLSSQAAEKALKSAHVQPEQVKTAVSTLSDQELAQLASRAHKAQADFAAGTLNNRELIIIIIAIAALVLIIVAVQHDRH